MDTPTHEEVMRQLGLLNQAKIDYGYSQSTQEEKTQARQTFTVCWDWFAEHHIGIHVTGLALFALDVPIDRSVL